MPKIINAHAFFTEILNLPAVDVSYVVSNLPAKRETSVDVPPISILVFEMMMRKMEL